MSVKNLGDGLAVVSEVPEPGPVFKDPGDYPVAVLPQSGGKIVQMPNGARIECGGECLRMALSNGGKIIGDAPVRVKKIFTGDRRDQRGLK